MELIILLILLIVIFGSKGSKLINRAANNAEMEKREEIRTKIYRFPSSELVAMFYEQRWELAEEIADDMKFIYGDNWKDVLRSDNRKECVSRIDHRFNGHWGVAFEVWIAKQGFIVRDEYRILGDFAPGEEMICDIHNLAAQNSINKQNGSFLRERGRKILSVIERYMIEKHPELDLKLLHSPHTKEIELTNLAWWNKLSSMSGECLFR